MSEQLNNEELVEVTTTQESILDKTKRFVQTHKTVLVTSGVVLAGLGITARLAWKKDSTSEPIEELFESEGKDLTEDVTPIDLESTDNGLKEGYDYKAGHEEFLKNHEIIKDFIDEHSATEEA